MARTGEYDLVKHESALTNDYRSEQTPMTTLEDVAKAARVSRATVSRVLNNPLSVKPATRDRISEAIKTLGYSPNLIAKSLAQGQKDFAGMVAVRNIMTLFPDVGKGHRFWYEVLRELTKAAQEQGLGVTVYYLGNDTPLSEIVNSQGIMACGAICCDLEDHIVTALTEQGIPVVLFDSVPPGYEGNAVVPDYRGGAYRATKHLLDLGHRRIAHITGESPDRSNKFSRLVLEGFQEAVGEKGITPPAEYIQIGDFSAIRAFELTQHLFSLSEPPTAIFASNDEAAMGVYRAANQLGLRIPDQVSVVSVDNLELATELLPPLTTVDVPVSRMAYIAMERLLRMVKDPLAEPSIISLPTKLIQRSSCAPLAQTNTLQENPA